MLQTVISWLLYSGCSGVLIGSLVCIGQWMSEAIDDLDRKRAIHKHG